LIPCSPQLSNGFTFVDLQIDLILMKDMKDDVEIMESSFNEESISEIDESFIMFIEDYSLFVLSKFSVHHLLIFESTSIIEFKQDFKLTRIDGMHFLFHDFN
jgi:hypothetical protein